MSKTDHGTVDVQVGTELYTLAFNLKAVKRIEKTFGGIFPAMHEVQKFSLHAATQVIVAGAGLALKPSAMEELEEEIYNSGIISVTPPLIEYLSAMLNPAAHAADQQAAAEAEAEAAKAKPKK
ncbi:hypothetical protein KDX38_23240 [Pseudomonas sp. CDFA 602]|uniref:hypothetical protein n=1 Tax=Pseudomonas californiensis TaxID=2829823 RepID=UPI001E2D435C|nr:hypothetical protein [Pseudomonas californiensis]MCD5996508.1 hypothetical protein [Pseudomonas californiensis]MCD6002107.1 hypothetical protein [Pseudomonas californiensis]